MSENNVVVKSYREKIYLFVSWVAQFIPKPIKDLLRNIGVVKFWRRFYSKYESELTFQRKWAEIYSNNIDKVREYYNKYRYLDFVIEKCSLDNSKKNLDIGCGISTILHYIEGENHGLDPLAKEYKKIYNYPEDMNIIEGFGEKIEFDDDYFDTVFSNNNLDHVTDPQKVVNEVHRVLKTGGHFVLNVEYFEKRIKDRDIGHPHSFLKDDIYKLISGKFKIVDERETEVPGIMNFLNGVFTDIETVLDLILVKV